MTELLTPDLASGAPPELGASDGLTVRSISPRQMAFKRFMSHKPAVVALVVLIVMIVYVLLSPVTARFDINEAIFTLAEGVASAEDIDTVMKLGMNHPMGPLTLADFIGLDTCLSIMEVLHAELGDDKYRPAPLLRKYVRAGLLGKKAGEGFFKYEAAKQPAKV